MVKYITKDRLSHAGNLAAQSVLKQHQGMVKLNGDASKVVLKCKYMGTVREDEPLRSNTQVMFHWIVGDDSTNPFEQRTLACKLLHCDPKPHAPRQLKIHLLCSLLPEAIVEHQLVPAMQRFEQAHIRCRGLALAKEHDAQYQTTFLYVRHKRVEHVKLAHISGKKWLVHPGTVLSTTEVFSAIIEDEPIPKKNKAIVERMETIPPCELRSKLFAVANFQAECLRAKEETRAVDTGVADAMFDKDSSKWTKVPKHVFVLWSSSTADGVEEHHATEVSFSTLFKGRL